MRIKKAWVTLPLIALLTGVASGGAVGPPAASAGPKQKGAPLAEVALFDPTSIQADSIATSGFVDYVYFQSLRRTQLQGISFFAEPLNATSGSSYFMVQIFETTSDWQTPGGNADRLFYAQVFLDDQGRVEYATAVPNLILRKGGYYRLSLQVANAGWAQPYALHSDYSAPFLTAGKEFRIFGSGGFLGPTVLRTPMWYLYLAPAPRR